MFLSCALETSEFCDVINNIEIFFNVSNRNRVTDKEENNVFVNPTFIVINSIYLANPTFLVVNPSFIPV